MKFLDALNEDRDISAVKMRNDLIKKFPKFRALGSSGSNPYVNFQILHAMATYPDPFTEGQLDAEIEKISAWFTSQGFKAEKASDYNFHRFTKSTGEEVATVWTHTKPEYDHNSIQIKFTGPKKAKRSTLPYYD